MENNENLNNQVNESNNTQPEVVNQNNIVDNNNQQVVKYDQALVENEPRKSNSGLVVLLMLIIVGVGGYFAYIKFIAKEEPKGNDKPTPTPAVTPTPSSTPTNDNITELTKFELNDSNNEFNISNTTIKLKKVEGKLYINDSVATIQNDIGEFLEIKPSVIYKTNKFIIISVVWQSIEYPYAINENGELINIKRLTSDTGQTAIHDLKLENNKVVATESGDGPDSVDRKVEFVYQIDQMSIKYEGETITKLEKYELAENNKEFVINNETILLKMVDGKLFINDKKCDSYQLGIDKVYLTNKFIIIEGGGQSVGYPYIINEKGTLVEVSGGLSDVPTVSIENIHLENGKLIATKTNYDEVNLDNTKTTKVELIYENGKAEIKEIK